MSVQFGNRSFSLSKICYAYARHSIIWFRYPYILALRVQEKHFDGDMVQDQKTYERKYRYKVDLLKETESLRNQGVNATASKRLTRSE